MKSDLFHHKKVIDEFLQGANHWLSGFSFVSIFIWSDFFDFRIEMINEQLCVFAYNQLGCFLYLPPLRKKSTEDGGQRNFVEAKIFLSTVQECFQIMEKTNQGNGISRIENVDAVNLQLFPREKFAWFNKTYEYFYFKEDLVSLKGNVFKSKRSSYNHFIKNYSYEFFPFKKEMSPACLRLYEQWLKNRLGKSSDDVYNQMLYENKDVHTLALKHYEELGLLGRVVVVDGEIKGYSFGFPLNKDVFCILFEITELAIKGLSVYIFREFCADPQLRNYKFINAMDDFGMRNIESVKLSFRPRVLFSSYVVTQRLPDDPREARGVCQAQTVLALPPSLNSQPGQARTKTG